MSDDSSIRASHPNGHFYSPVVDPAALESQKDRLWPESIPECLGIDFNDASHRRVLKQDFKRFIKDYDYPEQAQDESSFYTQNSQFSWLDARALFVLLRSLRPSRIIEVGSGFSSLLMADVNDRFLESAVDITCIEPYPRDFLRQQLPGLNRVIIQCVQDVPLQTFEQLKSGDLLFIDSSHVSKTGSDLNYLMFEVLPRLDRAVHIHFHDIFLPAEYLKEWVLEDNRSWNEQYLLRALLMQTDAYQVTFGSNYAQLKFPELVADALGFDDRRSFGGGSFWIQKKTDPL